MAAEPRKVTAFLVCWTVLVIISVIVQMSRGSLSDMYIMYWKDLSSPALLHPLPREHFALLSSATILALWLRDNFFIFLFEFDSSSDSSALVLLWLNDLGKNFKTCAEMWENMEDDEAEAGGGRFSLFSSSTSIFTSFTTDISILALI